MKVWHAAVGLLAVAVLLTLILASQAGLFDRPVVAREVRHDPEPLPRPYDGALSIAGVETTWESAGFPLGEGRWTVHDAEIRDSVHLVHAGNATLEVVLRFRLDDGAPVRLLFDEDLAGRSTFNFSYAEKGEAWDVAPSAGFLDILGSGALGLEGRFRVAFANACNPDCPEGTRAGRVLLEGRFPAERAVAVAPAVAAIALGVAAWGSGRK